MRVLPVAIGLTLALVGSSIAQASSNQGESAVTPPGRSAFFLPPPDPAEIRRCALPEAILKSVSRSACGSVNHADMSAALLAETQLIAALPLPRAIN
jgi:hypothetical protein